MLHGWVVAWPQVFGIVSQDESRSCEEKVCRLQQRLSSSQHPLEMF
jgi:hypothetical protein